MKNILLFPILFLIIPLSAFSQQDPRKYVSNGYSDGGAGVFFMNGKYGIVNTDGKVLLDDCGYIGNFINDYGYGYFGRMYTPECSNVIFEKNGKFGVFSDSTMSVIVKPVYDHAGWDDMAHYVFWGAKNRKVVFILTNTPKRKALTPATALVLNMQAGDSDEFPRLERGVDNTLVIDRSGRILDSWNCVLDNTNANGYFCVAVDPLTDKQGIFDTHNLQMMAPTIYKKAGFFMRNDEMLSEYIYVETFSGKYGAYNQEGNFTVDTLYSELNDFDPELHVAIGTRDYFSYLIDEHGKEILKSYSDIVNIRDTRLLIYYVETSYFLYDLDAYSDIAGPFASIEPISDDLFRIQNDTAFGIMDHSGRIIIPPIYDQIEGPLESVFIVHREDSSGLIDEYGDVLEPLRPEPWEMRTQEFDTLMHVRDSWSDGKHYSLELGLNEDDGPSDAPKDCPIGKCSEANENAAKNFILYNYCSSGEDPEYNYEYYNYFQPININEYYYEYDDDYRWDIVHQVSIAGISHFSFSIRELTTADEGYGEDDVALLNYYFPKDHWEELGIENILDYHNHLDILRDSIKSRSDFAETDPDAEVPMQFVNNTVFFQSVNFYVNDNGITFVMTNQADESLSEHIEYRLAYSEFTWKELMPYMNKDFISLLKRR